MFQSLRRIGLVLCLGLGFAGIAAMGCGGSNCQSECSPGTQTCQGSVLMTCGDFDGNGCTELGDPFTCPDQCLVDRCVNSCQDECPVGTKRCSGASYQVCSDIDGDSCTEWSNPQACPSGQTCTGVGTCTPSCTDQCSSGQRQCVTGANAYQVCECPAEGCCDWSTATNCTTGQSCSNGQCVSCQDECSPAGTRECIDSSSYRTCGEIGDGDPCNDWSAATACTGGQTCHNGTCGTACTDECPGVGAKTCTTDKRGFRVCGNFDTDPCREWGDATACATNELCQDGVCFFNCADECAPGERRCLGNGYQTCGNFDTDPCSEWSTVSDCKHNETCSNGVCSVVCQDECQTGARECSGFQSYRECGEFDHDPCFDWGEPQACNLWERCLDVAGPAECVIICFNDCEPLDSQQCTGDGYQVCGDFDWDACLEWGDVIPCGTGQLCSNGHCSTMPCEDDCATANARVCYPAEGGTGYRICGNFDSDACLDLSAVVECGADRACQSGECVVTCQDDCQIGQVGCVDSDTRWLCTEADSDPCLDRVEVNCATGQTCDASSGTCGTGCVDDAREPNDSAAQATTLSSSQVGLVICPDDPDWYRVIVGANIGLRVTIHFDSYAGDLDMELYRETDLSQPIAISAGISNSETVLQPAGAAAVYLVQVYGYAGASTGYDLTLELVGTGQCFDDYLEENDSMADPMFILDGLYDGLMLCLDDDDWYEHYMFDGEDLTVDLLFSNAQGDIDVEIVDEGGSTVAYSDSTTDDEHVVAPSVSEGFYYVHVYGGVADVENGYDMITEYGAPCYDDNFEPNNTMADAAPVAEGTYSTLVLCGNNIDWYSVTVPQGGDLLVSILFTHADGDLDLELYDANGTMLDYSVSTTDDEIVGATGLAAGVYYIKVAGWQGAENLYDLEVVF